MTEQERLKNNYQIALKTVKDVIGTDKVKSLMRPVFSVSISPRAKRRHGCCKYVGNGCIIEVSKHLFQCGDHEMIDTLIHEILHTFKDTRGHDYKWEYYANKISDNTSYSITRTKSVVGVDRGWKYTITCEKCGKVFHCYRLSKYKKYGLLNGGYACPKCKGTVFSIEEVNKNGK